MIAYLIFVVLALMAAPASADRTLYLYVTNQYLDTVYVITPWEMHGYSSAPPNLAGQWKDGWHIGTVYNVTSGLNPTVIPLYFILNSKSSHVLRVSKTYAGAKANDNSIACEGLPVTITQSTPNGLSIYAGANVGNNWYYCGTIHVW